MNIIQVRGLHFRYGGEPILNGVGFSVDRGGFTALIGTNGAGKSTLLKLLLGELSPDTGDIALFGEKIGHFKSWPRIGYVPQLNPASGGGFPATAEEIVCSGMYSRIGPFRPVRNSHRNKALLALELVGMRDFAGRMISELSGGQLQRVMIARALAADCELLLLDEPTAGVDSEASAQLYELLAGLNRNGATILMVTHDIARAAGYANRTLCLEEGSIVELDKNQLAHELSHRHKHPHV